MGAGGVYRRSSSDRLTTVTEPQDHSRRRILGPEHDMSKRIEHACRKRNKYLVVGERPEQIHPNPAEHLSRKLDRGNRADEIG